MDQTIAEAAAALAESGFKVFPCKPRDKVPAFKWKEASTSDSETVIAWWKGGPELNIGLPTGDVNGVFVIDIDGIDGEMAFKFLKKQGPLPRTVEAMTPRGRHVYFSMPPVDIRNSASQIGPHLDVRGNGGYVLAPPSIHPTGEPYRWINHFDDVDFAPAPDWLIDLAVHKNGNGRGREVHEWESILTGDIPEGKRNCTMASIVGHLLRMGVHPVIVNDLLQPFNQVRCNPPLHSSEVETIIKSIYAKEIGRRSHGF